MVLEMKIIKEELRFEENLKKRLEFICEFSKVIPTFVNGSIRKIDKTNISYIEPHRVIVKNTTFFVFNYSNWKCSYCGQSYSRKVYQQVARKGKCPICKIKKFI